MTSTHQMHIFSSFVRQLPGPLAVSLGYLVGAELAFYVGTFSDQFFAPFWPPNVVLFCALVYVPYSRWWIYIAAVLPVHILVEWQVAMPPPQIVVAFITNCAVAVLNALVVRQLLINPPWLDSFHRALLYVIGTACISPAVVAFGGAFVRIIAEGQARDYWTHWLQWYVSNSLASLTLGPILLLLLDRGARRFRWPSPQQAIEPLLLALALVGTCAVAFNAASRGSFTGFIPVLLYLPLPLVLWSTVRFGVKGASGAILIVTVVSIGMALDGYTIFGRSDADLNVLALQLFLTAFAVPVLLLGASVEGTHNAGRITRDLAQKLIWSHDEERRRTAKELHEGICQDLAAASLDAGYMAGLRQRDLARRLQKLERSLQKSITNLRSTSYLLYPPLLDESGLEPALRSFVESFSRGSSMSINLSVSADLGRLQSDIEIAVFRFVQDALNDISRRSGHQTAGIRVTCCGPNVIVSVAQGTAARASSLPSLLRKAVPITHAQESIDLAGMRARLQRIGGNLELETNGGATSLKAIIRTRRVTTEGWA